MTAMTPIIPPSNAHYEAAEALVRAEDKDRFLANLFAPETARKHLSALHAFSTEVARVREIVSDPLPGEIRLQWWRDALEGKARGAAEAHPIAKALLETVTVCRLPVAALTGLIEARGFDLYDDPMPTLNDLEGYCGETSAALIQLGAIALMNGGDPGAADAAGHAGVAYALTGILRAFPWHAGRGQCFLPLDVLAKHGASREQVVSGEATPALLAVLAEMRARARHHLGETRRLIGTVRPEAMPAYLPVALVEPYLGRMERADYHPFRTRVELPQWRRQWVLWRQARRALKSR
jgi:phytoene synthase